MIFAAYFVLAPGEHRQVTFSYRLPSPILSGEESSYAHYLLQVQKQPGTLAIPLQVHTELPPDAKALNTDPDPRKLNSEAVEYATKSQIHIRFEVVLQSDD